MFDGFNALSFCIYTGLNAWQQILLHYSVSNTHSRMESDFQAAMMIDVLESTWGPNKVFGGVYEALMLLGSFCLLWLKCLAENLTLHTDEIRVLSGPSDV